MLHFLKGDLFEQTSKVEAIINTVNCYGVMGKGIALEFKRKFPNNFIEYKKICDNKFLKPGDLFVVENSDTLSPKYIINFATKNHWKHPSKIAYIEDGLKELVKTAKENSIQSIAMPALGCGNGGLDWNIVKKIIIRELESVNNTDFFIYEPSDFPKIKDNSTTKKINLTNERKLLLLLIHHFNNSPHKTLSTYIEGNYLAYIAQFVGSELNTKFEFTENGPIASPINNLLRALAESEYILIESVEGKNFLKVNTRKFKPKSVLKNEEIQIVYQRTISLIDGFENPDRLKALVFVLWYQSNNTVKNKDSSPDLKSWLSSIDQELSNSLIIESDKRYNYFKEPKFENLSLDLY